MPAPDPQQRRLWRQNFFVALILYSAADFVAQLIVGEFYPWRLVVLSLVGISVYRVEIPRWFSWIENFRLDEAALSKRPWLGGVMAHCPNSDERLPHSGSYRLKPIFKGICSTLYFNPLWIARHMLVLELATHPAKIKLGLAALMAYCLLLGAKAFVINAPLSVCLNYILQNKIALRYRFIGSVFVSGFFGILYSLMHRYW
ncbi:MAG: hypothetical protein VKJ04_01970 [Vampirovibrionales bacterium]|nr:hypothetical protein [Vampirovibrionales bacterium]